MRVVLACRDVERADWLAHILGEDGFSVVVLSEVTPSSPELRGAELVILDDDAAVAIGDAGPARRVLLSARGATVNMKAVQGHFNDILVVPAPEEEVLARIHHVLGQ